MPIIFLGLFVVFLFIWILIAVITKIIRNRWVIFFTISGIVFMSIFLEESRYFTHDSYVTSSGDSAIRQTFSSRIIGFAIMSAIYFMIASVFQKSKASRRWIILPLVILFFFVYYENSRSLIVGTNGMRYYEFSFPFRTKLIGVKPDRVDEPVIDSLLYGPRIDSVIKQKNEIVFYGSGKANYRFASSFLFWHAEDSECPGCFQFENQ